MKTALSLCFIVCLGFVATGLSGCSGGDDVGQVPAKAEIDKGLEGRPAIDPTKSASGMGMKKGVK